LIYICVFLTGISEILIKKLKREIKKKVMYILKKLKFKFLIY
jgi:hypothetical protein